MKALPAYPFLYQINTRVWLTELSRALDRLAERWATAGSISRRLGRQ